MQRLEVSGAGRPLYGSLGVKGLSNSSGVVTTRKIRCRFWTAGSTPVRGIIFVHTLLRNSALRFV